MLQLDSIERDIADKIRKIKSEAGTHSPSLFTLTRTIPDIKIKIDACFLSNPYATHLFMEYLRADLLETGKLREHIELYPSQNSTIANIVANQIDVPPEKIFIGNGATEIIQAIIHGFSSKVLVNVPTFSAYYEFVRSPKEVVLNPLKKEEDFKLNVDHFVRLAKDTQPDTIVLINPNNPDGSYIPFSDVERILDELPEIENIILDESFIHFAHETPGRQLINYYPLHGKHRNLIIIKSMSKDFGVAGIRASYAVMAREKVKRLTQNGYLWNSNGLAEYFYALCSQDEFIANYERARLKYLHERDVFFGQLSSIRGIKTYPSQANFFLIELLDGSSACDLTLKLLIRDGVYVRNCDDKLGLTGEFIRVAARTREENQAISQAIRTAFYL